MNDNSPNKPIDFVFIDRYLEPFLHQIQLLTGVDCFRVAKVIMCTGLLTISFISMYELLVFKTNKQLAMNLIYFLFTNVIIFNLYYKFNNRLEQVKARLSIDARNREIFNSRNILFCFILYTLVIGIIKTSLETEKKPILNGMMFVVSLTVYFYYAASACTPLPPSKSELRKMFEKLSASIGLGRRLAPQT